MASIGERTVLKGRRDLIWQPQASNWLVYDPLARHGYRCGPSERWLFDQFDGQRCLLDVLKSARAGVDHSSLAWSDVVGLADTLLRRGLVHVAATDIAHHEVASSQRTWLQWFSQSVSWRMRGVNPQRFLQWLAPHTDAFFSALAVRVWIGLMIVVALLVLADFQRLRDQADLWQWIIKPSSGTTLFAIFVVTRAIHELGHALVLTRFGGRTPDIGVIFMLGAPCVYCDVTESWRLPHVWQRAAVSAGGMWAESILATLAGSIWLITTDGAVNTLALQTMIVCSISTWLINANPLMRFDGYYILSDWYDEPNLRARADACAARFVKRVLLGPGQGASRPIASSRFVSLTFFSMLGFAYRLTMSWMMASVIVAMYAAWHFEALGKWIALALLACWWGVPAMNLVSQLMRSAKTVWTKVRLGLLTAWAVLLVCVLPLPCRETGQGWVQPVRMQGLYAPQNARLEKIHEYPDARVSAGDPIFQLDDDALMMRAIDYQRQAQRAATQLESMSQLIKRNEPVEQDVRAAESLAESASIQAQHAREALQKMRVASELDGKLISLPAPKLQDIDGRAVVHAPALWLDDDQCGRSIPSGTMVAAVCSRQQLAVIPLKDSQLRDISAGTAVRFLLPSHSDRVWTGQVRAVVRLDELNSLARLSAATQSSTAGSIATRRVSEGHIKNSAGVDSTHTGYAAVIDMPMQDAAINSQVRAVFTAAPKTLLARANDWAHTNLRWLIE